MRHDLVVIALGLVFAVVVSSAVGVEVLPEWERPTGVEGISFECGAGKGQFRAWGRGRDYRIFFSEFLPALFERTVALDECSLEGGRLEWIFTGERGGFTVQIGEKEVGLQQRYYDSLAFRRVDQSKTRHPEWRAPTAETSYVGSLRAVAVRMDYKLGLSVALNGRTVLHQECLLDVSRHQLRLTSGKGEVCGEMLKPIPEAARVRVDPLRRHQTMIGFGGITTPTAYAQLSAEGKQRWWQLVCEYNLLIQR
jgi:hypothetical protein